jgi:hypothetical protein
MDANDGRPPTPEPTEYYSLEDVMSDWNSDRWRSAVVLTSATVFIACLTQTAFVSPGAYAKGFKDIYVESMDHSGIELLIFGWVGGLEALNPLVFFSIIAAWVFACNDCKKWRVAAVIAALFSIILMSIFPTAAGYAAWLANPIIAATWLLYLSNTQPAALISALVGLGLTLSFLWVANVPLGPKLNMVPIISYGVGYWLWVASAAIVVIGVSTDMFVFRYIASGHR